MRHPGNPSPVVTLRVPARLLSVIEECMDRRNARTRERPWTRTAFILLALTEKLGKMKRSRRSRRTPPGPAAPRPARQKSFA